MTHIKKIIDTTAPLVVAKPCWLSWLYMCDVCILVCMFDHEKRIAYKLQPTRKADIQDLRVKIARVRVRFSHFLLTFYDFLDPNLR